MRQACGEEQGRHHAPPQGGRRPARRVWYPPSTTSQAAAGASGASQSSTSHHVPHRSTAAPSTAGSQMGASEASARALAAASAKIRKKRRLPTDRRTQEPRHEASAVREVFHEFRWTPNRCCGTARSVPPGGGMGAFRAGMATSGRPTQRAHASSEHTATRWCSMKSVQYTCRPPTTDGSLRLPTTTPSAACSTVGDRPKQEADRRRNGVQGPSSPATSGGGRCCRSRPGLNGAG